MIDILPLKTPATPTIYLLPQIALSTSGSKKKLAIPTSAKKKKET
jgi:hypothetical protein